MVAANKLKKPHKVFFNLALIKEKITGTRFDPQLLDYFPSAKLFVNKQ